MSKSDIDYMDVYNRWIECNKLETAMLKGIRNGAATAEGWRRYRDCQQFFANAKKNYKQAIDIMLVVQNNPKYDDKKLLPKLIRDGDAAMDIAKGYSMLGILKS